MDQSSILSSTEIENTSTVQKYIFWGGLVFFAIFSIDFFIILGRLVLYLEYPTNSGYSTGHDIALIISDINMWLAFIGIVLLGIRLLYSKAIDKQTRISLYLLAILTLLIGPFRYYFILFESREPLWFFILEIILVSIPFLITLYLFLNYKFWVKILFLISSLLMIEYILLSIFFLALLVGIPLPIFSNPLM